MNKEDANTIRDDGLKILTPTANNEMNGSPLRHCQEFKISVATASISEEQLFETYGNDYIEGKSTPRKFAIILDQRLLDGESTSEYLIQELLCSTYLDRGRENITCLLGIMGAYLVSIGFIRTIVDVILRWRSDSY